MSDATNGHPVERLSAYFDDELSIEERAEFDHHLAECASCREHLDALRLLSRAVAEEPVPGVPEGLAERVGRRIDADTVVPLRKRRFLVPVTIAATIMAIGLVVVVTYKQGGPVAPPLQAPHRERAADATAGGSARASRSVAPPAPVPAAPPAAVPEEAAKETKAKSALAREAGFDRVAGATGDAEGGVEGAVEDVADRRLQHEADAKVAMNEAKDDAGVTAYSHTITLPPVPRLAPEPRNDANAALTLCGDQWLDAGVEATWEVADRAAALIELERLAIAHGGRLDSPGPGAPTLAFVVVPRLRYAEFAAAARVAGLVGLGGAAAPPETANCIRQRVTLRPPASR